MKYSKMVMEDRDEIDLQHFTENVSFLAECFDNSFAIQSSLSYIKDGIQSEPVRLTQIQKFLLPKTENSLSRTTIEKQNNVSKVELLSQIKGENRTFDKNLKNWGLPYEITMKYENKGIVEMFDWQVDCLGNSKVLLECQNLVYSAPTSAGKTLVAEILAIRTVLERQKKVIIILPFVSIVREKMFCLQDILSSSGVRVEGFMGSQSPPGGLQAVHIAICTIEKANSLINRLLDDGKITELGAVIVDELHLLGDPHRGYILELLLTKIKYISAKLNNMKIQIIGMSATLPNLEVLANWLDAELYITSFRPIPLNEYCLVGSKYYNRNGQYIGPLNKSGTSLELDHVLLLCLQTLKEGCSTLIFCMTKNRCENLAQNIASSFYKLGCSDNEEGVILREQLKSKNILEVLEQLRNCPVGLDQILKNIISFGVAYHHAGLTFDERDIIEGAFKSGAVRVLVATSTLSSGVNLPARKVIIRSPVFQKQPINILTYKQMIGRAGRMGRDTQGESVLICSAAEQKIGFELMMGALDPVQSCIESKDKFMRAILEIIASQNVCNKSELDLYTQCTLLSAQQSMSTSQSDLLEDTLKALINFELVRIQTEGDLKSFITTSLGKACLSSSMAPNDGLSLFCEIQKARQCLVLETDLHLIYLVTPYSVSSQWNDIDWLHLLTLWESLTAAMKRVGELVGVQESFIIQCLRSANKSKATQNKLSIHKRFYTALALQDLVNEVPLSEVASKFQCSRGFLQGLQQSSATFAGMVTAFCHQLGWKNMETLVSQFQDRLQFGIHSELLELMKLTSLNGVRARTLFDAGFETISSIALGNVNVIENTLYKSMPFQSDKEREGDDHIDVRKRNKIKNIWITGCCGMTTWEAAENLILEARKYLTNEIGVSEIKWADLHSFEHSSTTDTDENLAHTKQDPQIEMESQKIDSQNNLEHISAHESGNIELACKNDTSVYCDPKNSECPNIVSLHININNIFEENIDKNESNSKINNNSSLKEIEDCIEISENNGRTKSLCIPVKEELMWESLNLTGNVLDNITKLRTSDNIFSPNISFDDSIDSPKDPEADINNILTLKSAKDISLFSSEGDSSSLFEKSFDSITYKKVEKNTLQKIDVSINNVQRNTDYVDINSKSILNAFKSPVIKVDEDEDIKLVYDDENPGAEEMNLSKSQENEIVNTPDFNEPKLKNSFISPLKRRSDIFKDSSHSSAKKSKSSHLNKQTDTRVHIKLRSSKSKDFTIKYEKVIINCYVLRENDINTNFINIKNTTGVSIMLDTKQSSIHNTVGSNMIFKKSVASYGQRIDKSEELPVKGIAFCLNHNVCVYLDLTSLDKLLPAVKLKIAQLFSDLSIELKMLSTKSNYVLIKKLLGESLLSKCIDITLAEWLLDSDERISNIVDLTKKYCGIDLANGLITVGDRKKKYNVLDTCEVACLKAWCVWTVADKQRVSLSTKYPFLEKALHTETQIAKILANCEYHGINVDKNLASQLLIDVKNSQEALQKKAFKLCGYHFNFNSSKDVAKALGMYRGRKVSTRKSVLCARSGAVAALVLHWRKLHSILSKTLFPLTERAMHYSADDRIIPSYTMFTCTGRISMHEPNLQNVPRTFTIPLRDLNVMDDNEHCEDVVEFNCRNIFIASPGYVFVSADYCQLEMRILTHYCKDTVLTGIMRSDVDVFKSIAASWNGVPEEQVDEDIRQKAKQLCYGILYGMGNRTLAQHLEVDELEAAMFMDTFHKTYPAIEAFTRAVIDDCRNSGYVETLMRRRRYLPDINSNVASKRSAAERQAVNTTIQGSAADIAKAAMCAIHEDSGAGGHRPRLVLQLHDELIYEVIESRKNALIHTIKKLMENTVHLNVPLPVKVKTGKTWGSMEEFKF